jgi:hypothetical protein
MEEIMQTILGDGYFPHNPTSNFIKALADKHSTYLMFLIKVRDSQMRDAPKCIYHKCIGRGSQVI